MSVGDNIRAARINSKLNQKELAEKLKEKGVDVGNTTISNWENGTSKPDPDTIEKICQILNVDGNYILGFKNIENIVDDKTAMLFSKLKDLPPEKQQIILNVTESIINEIDKELDGKWKKLPLN